MKYLLVLALFSVGCVAPKAQADFEIKKEALEREIEILRLTKRKILLQNQLEDLESNPKK